jgi:uncharacterized SAM-binding protein YcdF (DUF218 family)
MKYFMLVLIIVCGSFIVGMQHFAHMIRVDAATPHSLVVHSAEKAGIAVLTGSVGRIEAGLTLLLINEGSRMLISGVGQGFSKNNILRITEERQDLAPNQLENLMACCIDLGPVARNTRGNAQETLRWAHKNNLDTIILVTADFHIPRALVEFRREMPDRTVIPHAVPTKGLGLDHNGVTQWWQSGRRLLTVAREYGKYLASLIS